MSNLINENGTSPSALIFWSVVTIGIVLRVWLSSLGHNYDLESYWEVSKVVLEGKSVYSETARYNYGPIWFLILGVLRRVTLYLGYNDIFHFHVLVGSFLTLIDVVIALFLRDKYSVACSLFFFINPVSILITGYHSQFDNAAILLGLLACSNLATSRRGTSALRSVVMSALVLGLSLATKHILIFFPFWLWWLYRNSSGSIRTSVLMCSYGCFGAFFVPYLLDISSITGITENVIKYGSSHGNGLIENIIGLFADLHLLENSLGLALSRAVFVAGTICAGGFWISRLGKRSDERDLFFLYLITLVTLTSSMADQYLAIPIIALARYHKIAWSWVYSVVATCTLLTSANNVFQEKFANFQVVGYSQTQIWLLFLLLTIWRRSGMLSTEK